MNSNKIFIALLLASCGFAGCVQPKIEVTTTKPWEAHYMTVDEFKAGTDGIALDKDESIWCISNKTLYNILTTNKQ